MEYTTNTRDHETNYVSKMEAEDAYINIQRVINPSSKRTPVRRANYIEPPDAIFANFPVKPEDLVVTAICWMLAKKPANIDHYNIRSEWTKEQMQEVSLRDYSDAHQLLVFTGMAGLMTIAKKVKTKDTSQKYLAERWQALCMIIGIEDIFTKTGEMFMNLVSNLEIWQEWIDHRDTADLRKNLLDMALQELPADAPVIVKIAIDQVKMILQDFNLKTIKQMNAFADSGSEAILIPAIAEQAANLRKAIIDLKVKYGYKFSFIKLYPLEGVDRLNYQMYPDLYYATVNSIIKVTELERRYMTDIQTVTPKILIDNYMMKLQTEMDDITLENLRYLGILPKER